MKDEPGGLAEVAEYLNKNGINISNAYGFILESKRSAVLVLEVDDFKKAESLINSGGFKTLSKEELHNL